MFPSDRITGSRQQASKEFKRRREVFPLWLRGLWKTLHDCPPPEGECVCLYVACLLGCVTVWRQHSPDSIFTPEAPCLPCWLCCYSFVCVLQVHERSHTGDKPYACDYSGCGRKFATGSHGAWGESLSLLLYNFHLDTCDLFTSLWPDYITEMRRIFSLYEDMMADFFLWSNRLIRTQELLQWHSW